MIYWLVFSHMTNCRPYCSWRRRGALVGPWSATSDLAFRKKTASFLQNTSRSSLPIFHKDLQCFKTDSIAFLKTNTKEVVLGTCKECSSQLLFGLIMQCSLTQDRDCRLKRKTNRFIHKTTSNEFFEDDEKIQIKYCSIFIILWKLSGSLSYLYDSWTKGHIRRPGAF